MQTVRWVATATVPTPSASEFQFKMSQSAAEHNTRILSKYDYDLDKAIKANPKSIISPGSELRPKDQLEPLLSHHPNYKRFIQNASNGIDYPAEDLPETTRVKVLKTQLQRGNHKSASVSTEATTTVNKLFEEDINTGYAIPITKEGVTKLKGGELYPMGLQHQWTIDENGNQKPKKRVTHDLSNQRRTGLSINQRVNEELMPETVYGYALLRYLHLIHHIRFNNPNSRILMCKSDFDKAYRRLHTTPRIASKCMAAWETKEIDKEGKMFKQFIASILTRLPFGSSPAPSEFSNGPETIFDLANDLLHCPHWDPEELPSPHIDKLPQPERMHDSIPFSKALKADVRLPPSQKAGVEGYIDDGAIAVLDSKQNIRMVNRAQQALPMATHLVFRPQAGTEEPLPRPDAQSIRKLIAEGRLREIIIFLGWEINSRTMMIALPTVKVIAWINSIEKVINKLTISWEEAKTLVGRLNHIGYIIPCARHFLNRIRRLEWIADKHGIAIITPDSNKDLKLWIKFLQRAQRGISINSVIFRVPTTIAVSDSCEYGVGGYCLKTGIAWRYEFTKRERESLTLNLKEFIGNVINGIIFLPLDDSEFPCLLSLGDSSCAAGWQYKSNFDPTSMHDEVARKHATVIMENNACDYSQHIPGLTNVVADCLSRDFHLSNSKLISMLYAAKPPYLPTQMTIIPLQPTIISWIGSLVLHKPKRKELPTRHTISTLAAGVSGWTSNQDATSKTPTWKNSATLEKLESLEPSCTQLDVEHLIHDPSKFQGPLRERPLAMWHRPLFQVVGLTQRKTQ